MDRQGKSAEAGATFGELGFTGETFIGRAF